MHPVIPGFGTARVLVVGDVMLDRYWHGETNRISPEAPVPVVRIQRHEDRPGGAANVALNVAALGAKALLVGAVGRDEAGSALASRMQRDGIETALVQSATEPTILKLRVMGRGQQLIRLDQEERFDAALAPRVLSAAAGLLRDADVVLLSDYGKGTLADIQSLIRLARDNGRRVLVDPKGRDFGRYRDASILAPNQSEFETFVGECADEDTLVEKAREFVAQLGLEALLITRGAKGMTFVEAAGGVTHFPARAREVFDVTGAGDTAIATLAAALAAGDSLLNAVALANVAAGIVVGKVGTSTVSQEELARAIATDRPVRSGVLTRSELAAEIRAARAAGERIVFTNGCFDILHAGHVGYLAQARALGDRLVVALNDDASVARLKGPGRPVNTVEQRMAVMAALKDVDWVVPFHEDTPIPLIEALRPDVLVKGGDYGIDGVVGGDIVRGYGGEVAVLAHLPGASTTSIVERIRR